MQKNNDLIERPRRRLMKFRTTGIDDDGKGPIFIPDPEEEDDSPDDDEIFTWKT